MKYSSVYTKFETLQFLLTYFNKHCLFEFESATILGFFQLQGLLCGKKNLMLEGGYGEIGRRYRLEIENFEPFEKIQKVKALKFRESRLRETLSQFNTSPGKERCRDSTGAIEHFIKMYFRIKIESIFISIKYENLLVL